MNNLSKKYDFLMIFPGFALQYLITNKVISCNISEGSSMEPTLFTSNAILVEKFFYKRIRKIKRGDIIIAKSPIDSSIDICKRIIHLENDYVDNIKIPKNHVWIEGDNKNNSLDSRIHGPIPVSLIYGRVLFSLYPFKKVA